MIECCCVLALQHIGKRLVAVHAQSLGTVHRSREAKTSADVCQDSRREDHRKL